MPDPPDIDWRQPEIAWPLALVTGFAGTWGGIAAGIPGLAALLAATLFAPLFGALATRGHGRLAAWLAGGWAFGVAAAIAGCAFESSASRVAALLPGSGLGWELAVLAPARGVGGALGPAAVGLGTGLLVAAAARPARGVLALLATALVLGAVLGGTARVAVAAAGLGWDAVRATAVSWPPHVLLGLAGCLGLACAVAEPAPLRPLAWVQPARRRLLVVGIALLGAAAVGGVVAAPAWAAWLGARGLLLGAG